MKIINSSTGKRSIRMAKSEWEVIGKKCGWLKQAEYQLGRYDLNDPAQRKEAEQMLSLGNHFNNAPWDQATTVIIMASSFGDAGEDYNKVTFLDGENVLLEEIVPGY